jgi:hypothetical protein
MSPSLGGRRLGCFRVLCHGSVPVHSPSKENRKDCTSSLGWYQRSPWSCVRGGVALRAPVRWVLAPLPSGPVAGVTYWPARLPYPGFSSRPQRPCPSPFGGVGGVLNPLNRPTRTRFSITTCTLMVPLYIHYVHGGLENRWHGKAISRGSRGVYGRDADFGIFCGVDRAGYGGRNTRPPVPLPKE